VDRFYGLEEVVSSNLNTYRLRARQKVAPGVHLESKFWTPGKRASKSVSLVSRRFATGAPSEGKNKDQGIAVLRISRNSVRLRDLKRFHSNK
jgi:hypothetical protein